MGNMYMIVLFGADRIVSLISITLDYLRNQAHLDGIVRKTSEVVFVSF